MAMAVEVTDDADDDGMGEAGAACSLVLVVPILVDDDGDDAAVEVLVAPVVEVVNDASVVKAANGRGVGRASGSLNR